MTLAAAALVAAAAFVGSAGADRHTPSLSALSRYTSFPDRMVPLVNRAAGIPDTWPFVPLTATGERVRIRLSRDLYLQTDTTIAQTWADFLDK